MGIVLMSATAGSPRRHSQANQLLSSSTGFRTSNGSCSSIAAAAVAASQQLSSTQPQQQQPAQQLHTQLSKLQLYDSSRYVPHRQDSQLQQDAAAAVESAAAAAAGRSDQHKIDSTVSRVDGSPGKLPTGLQAAAGHVPNLRYQQPSNGSTSGNANSLPRRGTADQEACNVAHCAMMPATVAAQAGTGSSSSGSWLAAAGAGWAPNDAADGVAPSFSPCSSGGLLSAMHRHAP